MPNVKEVIRLILSLKKEEQLMVIMLLWLWWQERNKIRQGNLPRRAEDLAYVVQKQVTELLKWEGLKVPSQQKHWRRPPEGFLKINTDDSFNPITGSAVLESTANK